MSSPSAPISRAGRARSGSAGRWFFETATRSSAWPGLEAVDDEQGEIDYLIARPYWRQGYGSEIAAAVTDYWFQTTAGQRLVAYVVPENVGSVRAVQKSGYSFIRSGVNYLDLMGNPPGITLATPLTDEYQLSRADWEARER